MSLAMGLGDAKRFIAYAKKQGLKHARFGDLEITFQDGTLPETKAAKRPKLAASPDPMERIPITPQTVDKSVERPSPPPLPTLDEIYAHIYATGEAS